MRKIAVATDITLGALELAGSLSGIPFAGAAATILEQIVRSCEEVVTHKREARRLMDKCTKIWNALPEKLSGQNLQEAVDEIEVVFGRIQRRVHQWSQYNRVTAWQIPFRFQAALYDGQKDVIDTLRSNTEEMRELLLQVITSQVDLQRIAEQQRNGENIAEPFMAAGQEELRYLRRKQLLVAPNRSLSPVPLPSDGQRYLQFQRGLMQLHKSTGIPPAVKILNGEVQKVGDLAVAGGTYSDIWIGVWLGEQKVALKALRNIKASDQKAQKRFKHEIEVWAELLHDHILPFYGVVTDLGQHIHMVSPWQDNGNVLDYVQSHPTADRMCLVGFNYFTAYSSSLFEYQIWGAANGLKYLHSRSIVHGNVKCANILVTKEGEARICDFGMSKIVEEVTEKSASATLTEAGSARWLAPELIEGLYHLQQHRRIHRKRDASVIHDIVVLKKTPVRPTEDACKWLTDGLWRLMQSCWCNDAGLRPPMSSVASEIQNLILNK
ncbi:kinase-like domain-containing protein [Cyathus striatus]|nr:kinase-like domain-containing protein [Cyathus striatus]